MAEGTQEPSYRQEGDPAWRSEDREATLHSMLVEPQDDTRTELSYSKHSWTIFRAFYKGHHIF